MTQGPPASSQSGESTVQTVRLSPSQVPTGVSPSTVDARLPLRSHWRPPQSMPRVSGFWLSALTASPSSPRRPLPVPRTVSSANTASTPLSVVSEVSPDALRSKNVGSEAKWTENVIGAIARPMDAPTSQPPPGHGSPMMSTVPVVSGSCFGSRSPTWMWLDPPTSQVLWLPKSRAAMPGVRATARQTGAPPAAVFAAMKCAQLASVPPVLMQSQQPFGSKLEHVAFTGTASQDAPSQASRSKVGSPWSGTTSAQVQDAVG